jgi:putative toxin-antitoxin system antitoxin component (TIGR02293 family)
MLRQSCKEGSIAMQADKIADFLGGPRVLGARVTSSMDLVNLVRAGLPSGVVDYVLERELLSRPELERYVIPRRTLAHRKQKRENLSPQESDRLARLARVMALAEDTFQNRGKAHRWMRRANRSLGGMVPVELLDTDEGARLVETVLGRISHGIYA